MTCIERLERSLRPNAVVQVTVPSRDKAQRALPSRHAKNMVYGMILEVSAGATTLQGEGVWRRGDSPPVREPVLIVFTHLPDRIDQAARRRFVRKLQEFIRWARQDALLVVVNNRPFYLDGGESSVEEDSRA